MNLKTIIIAALCLFMTSAVLAQTSSKKSSSFKKRVYITSSAEGSIYSTSLLKIGNNSGFGWFRYSSFFNAGIQIHKDFSPGVGLFTGFGMKNIGYIYRVDVGGSKDSVVKRRVYTLGAPLGLKIGRMRDKYLMLGGGVDIPFNYKEKGFVKRSDKVKYNEWFSDRTARFLPYAFVGGRLGSIGQLKLQYYPTNMMNQDYVNDLGFAPYANVEANMILLTFGRDLGKGANSAEKKARQKKRTEKFLEKAMPNLDIED